jgi:hypothetical protein
MQCPRCDSIVEDSAVQCPSCGLVFESEPTVAYVELHDPEIGLTPEEASSVDGISGWALVVGKGPRAGMTFLLHPGEINVGRHPESDILLDDVTVSRQHCRFDCTESSLSVADLGSTNGTYVNDERVEESVLAAGDQVLIGRFQFVVAHGDR